MKIETSTHVRLWFEVQTIITVKKTTGAVARGDEKDSQERELNHWRSDCRELANSEFVFTELPSELSLSRTDSTWNVKSMTIYMAPERCNTNSEVNSSQMSCWRSTQRNRAANGYILVQVWIFFNKLPCNCSSSFLNVMVIIAAYKKKNMSELCIVRKKTVYGFINAWVPNVIKLNACIGRYIPTD